MMECEIYLWLMPHKVQVITENQRNRLESCECVACSDFNKSHQPAEVEGSSKKSKQQENSDFLVQEIPMDNRVLCSSQNIPQVMLQC